MSGIYIHIPFCKQACFYCNFHFSTSVAQKSDMLAAMHQELRMHAHPEAGALPMAVPHSELIETVYFGGGTPSILSAQELGDLALAIKSNYHVSSEAEWTLEANPDDMTPEKLAGWGQIGINRLSIGIQSFNDDNLRWMHRAHDGTQAYKSIEMTSEAGFRNYSVDLIFGLPGLSDDQWRRNIDMVVRSAAPHIACYALTVEPRTPLEKMIRVGKKEDVDEDTQARQFHILIEELEAAGYEHYEISNFALPGFRSRHNSSYWQQKRYLGIGPSAHSFDGRNRYWNIANNALYIKAIREGRPFFEMERLTTTQQINEYIMTSLRTAEGMDLAWVTEHFGTAVTAQVQGRLNDLRSDWYELSDGCLRLTKEGKLFADRISVLLFQEIDGDEVVL